MSYALFANPVGGVGRYAVLDSRLRPWRPTSSTTATSVPSIEETIQLWSVRAAEGMVRAGQEAGSEEDVRHRCNILLEGFIEAAELNVQGQHEYRIGAGRLDSKYQGVLLEYKDPRGAEKLVVGANGPGNRAVATQLRERFEGLARDEGAALDRLFGVGCDGLSILFLRHQGGRWALDSTQPVTPASIERLLRALVSLGARGKSFRPESLAEDFGAASEAAQTGIRDLYAAIVGTEHPRAKTFFEEWQILFGEVCGYDIDGESSLVQGLARQFGIPKARPAQLLFAIHTYYALFMKFLAAEVTSSLQPIGVTVIRQCVGAPTNAALKRELERLEQGGIWSQLGIRNFLEGDIFAWYLDAWNDGVAGVVRKMVVLLDEYDPITLSGEPAGNRDLLKRLYHRLLPREVRHALGEYYTPDWLAEYVLDRIGYDGNPDLRVLDPACGSGTFLVAALNRAKAWFAAHRHECGFGDREFLMKLLSNVVGFDLNPLAVMASRTNYLLAIRDLLRYAGGSIELPVYLCDSIQIPGEFGDLLSTGKLGVARRLRTSAGDFVIPLEVGTSRELIGAFAEAIEHCVRNQYPEDEFLDYEHSKGIPTSEAQLHRNLYGQIKALQEQQRNGMWARIIRNQFAPLFTARVDFVVGNPPWVSWQHLPEGYREDTAFLWDHYGLTGPPAGGGRQRSRQTKTDVAFLMTYAAADLYLRDDGGRLGFVMTQTAFQSELGGRQFRQFALPSGTKLRVQAVTDMVRVRPFEDAANRTSVLLLEKGAKTAYPVAYQTWARQRGARLTDDLDLPAVLERTVRRDWVAAPVAPKDPLSAWMVGRADALAVVHRIVGRGDYAAQVREGTNTRGANGVFYVDELARRTNARIVVQNKPEMGRRRPDGTVVERESGPVESEFLYPLVTGREVSRWLARPQMKIVLPHSEMSPTDPIPEGELRRQGPNTYAFLNKFKAYLRTRRPFRNFDPSHGPFYGLYSVGTYTFAPYKVVWREIATDFIVAPLRPDEQGKPLIPNHKLMVVPVGSWDEALYLAGILSASLFRYAVLSYAVSTQISTHVLEHLQVPRYSDSDSKHLAVVAAAAAAFAGADSGDSVAVESAELQLNRTVAKMWRVTASELAIVSDGLSEVTDFLAQTAPDETDSEANDAGEE